MSKKKVCIIIERPFQLLNYLNYLYHLTDRQGIQFDAFIREASFFPPKTIERVKQTNLFNNVYSYSYSDMDFDSKMSSSVFLHRLKRFLFPKSYIESISKTKPNLVSQTYDYMYCSNGLIIAKAYSLYNPSIKIVLFDDGIGSYSDNIKPNNKKRNIRFFLKGGRNPWDSIEKIYINNLDIYSGTLAKTAEPLPPFGEGGDDFNVLVDSVFDYKGCGLYNEINTVFLDQPFMPKSYSSFIRTESAIVKTIISINERCILRMHPQQTDAIPEFKTVDTTNDMWELVCSKQINNKHVLIGCYSTAQITPKILCDLEPWLVFTYKLYGDLFSKEQQMNFSASIDRLRKIYNNPGKVIEVRNIDELDKQLRIIEINNKAV